MKSLQALLALAVLLAPVVAAQEPVTTHIADDLLGDVKVEAQGQAASPPADAFAAADLKSLDVTETPDEFVVTLAVATLQPQAEAPFQGSTQYFVHLDHNGNVYRVRIARSVFGATFYSARLDGFDPGRGGYFVIMPLEVQADPATATLVVPVPRHALVDPDGAAPHPEVPLTGFRASSAGLSSSAFRPRGGGVAVTVAARDAMPDSGNATAQVEVSFGARQSGTARLSSDTPTRASNGEATTFVFQVQARNLGTGEDTYTLSTTAIPNGWQVQLPATQITVPGNGSVALPIIVATPFTHTHGSFQNFLLQMRSVNDPASIGQVQLGVRYSQPPQPAGHHATVWLHSAAVGDDPVAQALFTTFGFSADVYMNADEQDPTDQKVEVVAENMGTDATASPPRQRYLWEVPLSPGLEMGLDFDTAGKGALVLNLRAPAPVTDAVVSGALVHYGAPNATSGLDEGPMTVLADLVPTAPRTIDSAAVQVPVEVVPRPAADFVPFQKGASLVLWLNLTTTRLSPPFATGNSDPVLAPGSALSLPLVEYHDPVDDIFVSEVELVVDSVQDRFASPGQKVLYNLTLHNRGARDGSFLIEMGGLNSGWARLLPSQPVVAVAGGASHRFHVVVEVPGDVEVTARADAPKTAADVVISATNQDDFNQRSLARLYTTVDDGPFADDSALIAELEKTVGNQAPTPGVEAALLLGAVAVLALARRRRA